MTQRFSAHRSPEAEAYRAFYKDKRWRGKHGIRARRLSLEPLCRMCSKRGHITVATVVDHITEHKGDRDLFFAFSNTQSLCAPCHDSEKQSIEARGYDKAIGEDGWPIDEAHPANACGGGIQAQPAEISARQLQGKS